MGKKGFRRMRGIAAFIFDRRRSADCIIVGTGESFIIHVVVCPRPSRYSCFMQKRHYFTGRLKRWLPRH